MSITKEAIERAGKAIREGSYGIVPVPFGKETRYGSVWMEDLMKQGISILEEAQIPKRLQKLADAIRPEFPDVELKDPHLAISTGSVALTMVWDTELGKEDTIDSVRNNCSLSVIARVASGEITVCTSKGWIPLSREEWGLPDKMDEAIIFGYSNPILEQKPIRGDSKVNGSMVEI